VAVNESLHALAATLGVHTQYTDGLGNQVRVGDETLVRVCRAMGAAISCPADAVEALRNHAANPTGAVFAPVSVAWDGMLQMALPSGGEVRAELELEDGSAGPVHLADGVLRATRPLPLGYHRLVVLTGSGRSTCTVISAPVHAFRLPGERRRWGVAAQLAALRSGRSRSVGDLQDLESLCSWLHAQGGDAVMLLPLLPTFNTDNPEPSPYSPVSRLFWSELMLDLGGAHRPVGAVSSLDVSKAHAEVWSALSQRTPSPEASRDPELLRYARFRGVQARMGRNWREWPAVARGGELRDDQVDPATAHFHLVAQDLARQQLGALSGRLRRDGFGLGLDLTVGVHADGYDAWSRQQLFAEGMSVGAPPDPGFPSGQDWGFSPLLPQASRLEGHRYAAASLVHHMAVADVLRVDHIMALSRLYWIPHGMALHEGTYVAYPSEELLAVLTLESHRHRCEVVGENLGTVPEEVNTALQRHRIRGIYLAQFQATGEEGASLPAQDEVASFGSHDTPTLAGWLAGDDIDERGRHGLLAPDRIVQVREARAAAIARLAVMLGASTDDPNPLLLALLEWLGRSPSELVVPWFEDLWLEVRGVNIPGTRASERANWQRPMRLLLEDLMSDPQVEACLRTLRQARAAASGETVPS
jgi:4-alpha-glucanotransferase